MGKQCLPPAAEQAAGLSTPARSVGVVMVHGLKTVFYNYRTNQWMNGRPNTHRQKVGYGFSCHEGSNQFVPVSIPFLATTMKMVIPSFADAFFGRGFTLVGDTYFCHFLKLEYFIDLAAVLSLHLLQQSWLKNSIVRSDLLYVHRGRTDNY